MLTLQDLDACEGLAEAVARSKQYAAINHPVLIRGETSTARIMAQRFSERPVAEVFCSLISSSQGGLRGVLRELTPAMRQIGAVLFVEADQLAPVDQNLLNVMCRDRVVDARGTPLATRIVCQFDPRTGSFAATPGACLELDIPALADRAGDSVTLFERLLTNRLGHSMRVDSSAAKAMRAYSWPGDLPELLGRAEQVALRWEAGRSMPVMASELNIPHERAARKRAKLQVTGNRTLRQLLDEYEMEVLQVVMTRFEGNKSQAARELGISRSYLIQKCQHYGIE